MTKTPEITAVVAFLEEDDGRFLLMQRSSIVFEAGSWALVGGALEEGLAPVEGLLRKIHAEIHRHYRPDECLFLGTFSHQYPDLLIHAHVFKIRVGKSFVPFLHKGHTDYAWVTVAEAYAREYLLAGLYPILRETGAVKLGKLPDAPAAYYAYMVQCADGTFYCGFTNNLEKRLVAHNAGKGAKYTRGREPVHLVYHETFPNERAARKREAAMKRMSRACKIDLVQGA